MKSKPPTTLTHSSTRRSVRPGEIGVAVNKVIRPVAEGISMVTLTIDVSDIPVPDRRYTADVSALEFDGAAVRWCFGQKKIGTGLRSLVVVHLAPENLHSFAEMLRQFIKENEAFLLRNSIPRIALTELTEEPAQTVAVTANIVAVARAGREASIDFFNASPHAIHSLQKNASDVLAVDPIIRVDLPIGLMTSAIDWIVKHLQDLPQELR